MNVAGQLRVLTNDQMQTVHEKACELLEKKGIVFETDECVDIFKKHGCKVEGNTVFISKNLVDKSLAQVPKTFTLTAPNPARSVVVGEGLLIHPAGGEVFIQDYNGQRRMPTLKDFSDIQKVYQACKNIDIAGYAPISPHDLDPRKRNLWTMLESLKASDKPILSPMEIDTIEKKEEIFKLFEVGFGKDWVANNYFTWHVVCPNSPYLYSEFACDGIKVYAERNQPICIVSAPMSGITSPVFLVSTLILTIAEDLAGLVLAQLIKPGVPVVLSASLTYGYMRTASWECASPDTSLMLASSIQMFKHFYRIPARAQTGVTSSKAIDYQAGMEVMQSFLYSALAGVNLTSQTVGTLANLMTVSLEKTVLDDELVSRVRHMVNGLTFNEEQMGMEDLFNAAPGSDFLTNDSTLEYFREYWAPTVSDWRSTEEWEADGSRDVEAVAHEKVVKILEEAPESLLDPEQEKDMIAYINSIE
ncbi:MAG: trimethylamine methyltransferase family protein [Coriobacteriia bacterium]|nr:trimethylamine methyltransferase family protein [Coriobacteriia bacterium]MCL2749588.1 trimethylamine methyltransferase family protein [Coriobacteriia bacterium]